LMAIHQPSIVDPSGVYAVGWGVKWPRGEKVDAVTK
jgi:hypothetical protein